MYLSLSLISIMWVTLVGLSQGVPVETTNLMVWLIGAARATDPKHKLAWVILFRKPVIKLKVSLMLIILFFQVAYTHVYTWQMSQKRKKVYSGGQH
jgi:hypothetical protein